MVAKDQFEQEAVWGAVLVSQALYLDTTALSYVYLEKDLTEVGENCVMGVYNSLCTGLT
jgi:hypothetical protein